MNTRRSILIKLSGELFSSAVSVDVRNSVIEQLATLASMARIGIVIGGGNFFRGKKDSKSLGICETAGHDLGMLATVMNGRILQSLLKKQGVKATLLSAFPCPSISQAPSSSFIAEALSSDSEIMAVGSNVVQKSLQKKCIIFAGGIGVPFFTTDTAALVRGLQMNVEEVWKATTVDGIYDDDPRTNPQAKLLSRVSFDEVLEKRLEVMDQTAMLLAREHEVKIRIFNLFTPDSLISAYNDQYYHFGSIVHKGNL